MRVLTFFEYLYAVVEMFLSSTKKTLQLNFIFRFLVNLQIVNRFSITKLETL